jgi:glutaredoxin 3
MKRVTVYTKPACGYCTAAEQLLRQKGIDFTEIDVTDSASLRREMITRSGRYTVPQIFVEDYHVGGCHDLFELDSAGVLDDLLNRGVVPA